MKNELKDNNVRFEQIQLAGDIDPNKVIGHGHPAGKHLYSQLQEQSDTHASPNSCPPRAWQVRHAPVGYPEISNLCADFLATFMSWIPISTHIYANNLFSGCHATSSTAHCVHEGYVEYLS